MEVNYAYTATVKETIQNGGWKFMLLIAFLLFYSFYLNDFELENYLRITFGNIVTTILFVMTIYINVTGAVKEIRVTDSTIEYKTFINSNWKIVSIETISHLCYYEKSISRYRLFPSVEIFLNTWGKPKGEVIYLNFPIKNRYTVLSVISRLGFKVLLFEELKNVDESDYYVTEKEITAPNTAQKSNAGLSLRAE